MLLLELLIDILDFGELLDIISLCDSAKITIKVFKKDMLRIVNDYKKIETLF